MKIVFRRDPEAAQTLVQIIAREKNAEVEAILRRLKSSRPVMGYGDRGETPLRAEEIIRVYSQQRRVLADSDRGTFALRLRLYELEEMLDEEEFVRISNSEIVSRSRILQLDYSLTGTIRLSLKGGIETYVSRRYVSRIRRLFES